MAPGFSILCKWAGRLTKLDGDGECRLSLFHTIRNFLENEIYHFSMLSHQTTFLFEQSAPFNQPLIQPLYRSWDYLEHFGIYSQLNRKSKTWFFIFLNVYISWIERDKIQVFCRPEWTGRSWSPWKWFLTNFKCKNEVPKQLGLEKQIKKLGH